MKDYLQENLLSDKFAKRGIVKKEVVTKLVNEHLSSEKDHVWQLWTLLMLEL